MEFWRVYCAWHAEDDGGDGGGDGGGLLGGGGEGDGANNEGLLRGGNGPGLNVGGNRVGVPNVNVPPGQCSQSQCSQRESRCELPAVPRVNNAIPGARIQGVTRPNGARVGGTLNPAQKIVPNVTGGTRIQAPEKNILPNGKVQGVTGPNGVRINGNQQIVPNVNRVVPNASLPRIRANAPGVDVPAVNAPKVNANLPKINANVPRVNANVPGVGKIRGNVNLPGVGRVKINNGPNGNVKLRTNLNNNLADRYVGGSTIRVGSRNINIVSRNYRPAQFRHNWYRGYWSGRWGSGPGRTSVGYRGNLGPNWRFGLNGRNGWGNG